MTDDLTPEEMVKRRLREGARHYSDEGLPTYVVSVPLATEVALAAVAAERERIVNPEPETDT